MKHLLKNLLFFFFLVSNLEITAQPNKVKDSLENIIATAKEDSTKLKAYRQLEFQCQDRKEYIAVNKRELALAEKAKDYFIVANMKSNLAYFEYTDGRLAESEKLYLEALSIGTEKKFDVVIGGVYHGLMMLSWKQANIDNVMKYYKLGEDFLSQAKSYKFLTRLYFSASDIFRDLKMYDKALLVATLSVNASLLSKDSATISGAYSIVGNQLVVKKTRFSPFNVG